MKDYIGKQEYLTKMIRFGKLSLEYLTRGGV